MKNKIYNKENLSRILLRLKKSGKKIAHCHGVFDLIHLGHLEHFNKAKNLADILIVSVTIDKYVNKGPNQPFFSTQQRLKALSYIQSIDYVIESNTSDAMEMIRTIKPDYYCKGNDYKKHSKDLTRKIGKEIKYVKKFGGKIIYTNEISFSSSKILNENDLTLSKEQSKFIKSIKKNYKFENLKKIFDDFKKIKILIVGETIIDKYVFCEAIGKSGKDPMLVFNNVKAEEYLGGVGAVANHLSEFCDNVKVISAIGGKNERSEFIKSKLKKNIKSFFFKKESSPTISKTRFVDLNSQHKMLGVYDLNSEPLSEKQSLKVSEYLKKEILKFDIVLVYDYGHGFLNQSIADVLSSKSKFMALNAQVNSNSISSHSIQKYKKSNYLIINESELRHEVRDNTSSIEKLLKKLQKKIHFDECVVTQGMSGASLYQKKINKFVHCPAFASKVIDKIGAGDSFLPFYSVTSLLKLDKRLSLLLGSLAAAQSVESIGNSVSINKNKMLKTISHIIK
jgi:rfaE bifunctional protein kinase chain/domain